MVKFRFMLIAILLVSTSANMSAAWRIVFDRNCLKIVLANTASQKLIEEQHNQRVDTIAAKKQKVELYTVSMATMKELYKLSMENISGFGTESLYYKEIGLCALDILRNVPVLVSTVNRAKFSNKLLCLNVSIRPTTGIKPLYTTIATVTMNLIVSAAIVLLNQYITVCISY